MGNIRKLEVVSPVPADIDVANSVKPLHITAIAEELGLKPEEYDCYGKSKAKVLSVSPSCVCDDSGGEFVFPVSVCSLTSWSYSCRV